MFKSISLIFVILAVQGALSQVIIKGKCPKTTLAKNVDMKQYSGVWYGYSKYPFAATNDLKCNYAKYIQNGGNDLTVSNGGLNKSTKKTVVNNWKAKVVGNAQLAIAYDSKQSVNKVNYEILGTDYKNWAAAYFCTQLNSTHHSKNAWLLTRTRFPFSTPVDAAKEVFIKNHVTLSLFVKNDQYQCPTSV